MSEFIGRVVGAILVLTILAVTIPLAWVAIRWAWHLI